MASNSVVAKIRQVCHEVEVEGSSGGGSDDSGGYDDDEDWEDEEDWDEDEEDYEEDEEDYEEEDWDERRLRRLQRP